MQETLVWSLAWEDSLEKEMVTHYRILDWKIPWTERPGGLQSIESQRVTRVKRLSTHAQLTLPNNLNWRRQWHPTPVLLPGKSHGWRSLVGRSPWGLWGLDTTVQLHFHFSLSCTGEGNGNPLQCSCLENPRDGGAWWAAVCGVAQSRTWLKRLSSSSKITQLREKQESPLVFKKLVLDVSSNRASSLSIF